MCFTIQRMNEIKQNSALECNFFCDVKKEGMDICKSRNIYFHGVFFFTWITPIKNFNIQFYILYMYCVHVYCNIILVSTYDQIIFKSRYLQIFFLSFCKSNLKKSLPENKDIKIVTFCNFDYATLYTACWGTKGEILHRVRHTYIIS